MYVFFFKQKTAYEMRISDWSSDVCSSDLLGRLILERAERAAAATGAVRLYVDTSTNELYAPTRAFYRRAGYRVVAEMPDFFREGDGKAIFMKPLEPETA